MTKPEATEPLNSQNEKCQCSQICGGVVGQKNMSFRPMAPSRPPVTTIGLVFNPVEAEVMTENGPLPFMVWSICQYPIYDQFTLQELRYFDYLRHQYAIVPPVRPIRAAPFWG
jgi:hypothetical protein